MTANAVMFENPMPKIYQMLPPSKEELDDVAHPLLVRRKKVANALEWLKLNHCDYLDLDIDYDNLEKYPEGQPPVEIVYRQTDMNKNPESASAYDNETEEGVDDGACPFVVNGVMGEELDSMPLKALKAKAAIHLKEERAGVLVIRHSEELVSMYDNPQLYPMMFPWLFPYGLGGIGGLHNAELSMLDTMHKQRLLMYQDKRFQCTHFDDV
ncbi:hypothetical protein FIBSPDRAFT_911333 [Athelia psychrophila]|uniref:DUF6570 domain-containing protein n=1 Tax=Athelia psychrophila TaxID=1759441 RepID=A0A166ICA8_9AGAM|nr:hypothetical protein FIBSPDRAFT_911333 [Fibularhizoctonia sp. CBS 109695]